MDLQIIQNKIYELRGQKVMLDFDLAVLYEVETKRLNEQVKRNITRFPEDFMFQLSQREWDNLKSQNATSSLEKADDNTFSGLMTGLMKEENVNRSRFATGSQKHRGKLPYAFTEHGVTMLASVLRSEKAVEVNIAIVRAFIELRSLAMNYKELMEKIMVLEDRYDMQFLEIYAALNKLIGENNKKKTWEERERIGYKNKN